MVKSPGMATIRPVPSTYGDPPPPPPNVLVTYCILGSVLNEFCPYVHWKDRKGFKWEE